METTPVATQPAASPAPVQNSGSSLSANDLLGTLIKGFVLGFAFFAGTAIGARVMKKKISITDSNTSAANGMPFPMYPPRDANGRPMMPPMPPHYGPPRANPRGGYGGYMGADGHKFNANDWLNSGRVNKSEPINIPQLEAQLGEKQD